MATEKKTKPEEKAKAQVKVKDLKAKKSPKGGGLPYNHNETLVCDSEG